MHGSYGYIIMQIPKEGLGKDATRAIWGMKTDDVDRREKVFLLPKYIKGFVINNRYIEQIDRNFRPNDAEDREDYSYFLMDSSYISFMDAMETETIFNPTLEPSIVASDEVSAAEKRFEEELREATRDDEREIDF